MPMCGSANDGCSCRSIFMWDNCIQMISSHSKRIYSFLSIAYRCGAIVHDSLCRVSFMFLLLFSYSPLRFNKADSVLEFHEKFDLGLRIILYINIVFKYNLSINLVTFTTSTHHVHCQFKHIPYSYKRCAV